MHFLHFFGEFFFAKISRRFLKYLAAAAAVNANVVVCIFFSLLFFIFIISKWIWMSVHVHIMMMWWFDALYKVTSNSFQQLWRLHLVNCIVYRYSAIVIYDVYEFVWFFFIPHFCCCFLTFCRYLYIYSLFACFVSKTRIVIDVLKSTPSYLATFIDAVCSQWNHTHFSRSLVARFDYGYVLARISHHSWCIMQKPRSPIIIPMDIHSVDKFDSLDFRHNAWIWFDFVHQPPVVHPYRDNKRKQ